MATRFQRVENERIVATRSPDSVAEKVLKLVESRADWSGMSTVVTSDRMLAAQALALGIPIIGNDAIFDSYGVARIWN